MSQNTGMSGFTLPELLVACAAVVLVAVCSMFLLHPNDYTQQARNAQRWQDVALLSQSLDKYIRAGGSLPAGITTKVQTIGSETGTFDICTLFVPTYMDQLPLDPLGGVSLPTEDCLQNDTVYTTGYTINKTADGSVVIAAPYAENSEKINITRKY